MGADGVPEAGGLAAGGVAGVDVAGFAGAVFPEACVLSYISTTAVVMSQESHAYTMGVFWSATLNTTAHP